MSHTQLDRLDLRILRMLSTNGRKPYLEIARECNVSGAAIHQRIAKLNAAGVLVSVEAILDPHVLGYNACAYVSLTVNCPVEEAVSRLEAIPEVVDCHVVMGEEQLIIKLYARSNEHLAHLLNDRIRPIGVVSMHPSLSLSVGFHRPLPVGLSEGISK